MNLVNCVRYDLGIYPSRDGFLLYQFIQEPKISARIGVGTYNFHCIFHSLFPSIHVIFSDFCMPAFRKHVMALCILLNLSFILLNLMVHKI